MMIRVHTKTMAVMGILPLLGCARYATDSAVQSATEAEDARIEALEDRVAQQETEIAQLVEQVTTLQDQMAATASPDQVAWIAAVSQGLLPTVDDSSTLAELDVSGVDLIVEGANLTVRNSMHDTSITDGTGNIIVGWNETDGQPVRTGSHNLVLGDQNSYTGYGAIVSGERNQASSAYGVVLGGSDNVAEGMGACVLGGSGNFASGQDSAVVGGSNNRALAPRSSVTGGSDNRAGDDATTDPDAGDQQVSGGADNHAVGAYSSVAGGNANWAYAKNSSITGGYGNIISAGAENAVVTCGTGLSLSEPDVCSEDQ